MMTVTAEAKDVLKDMLEQASDDEELGIRMVPAAPPEGVPQDQAAIGLMLDRPQEGDEVVEYEGRKVLVLDPSMSAVLDGSTLTTVDTPDGRRLAINPPSS